MKDIIYAILIFTLILLFGCAIQALIIYGATENIYQFEQYNFTAWLFQILYWIINITLGLHAALDEIDY